MRCIGFGDREDVCENEATTPAGIWCVPCEEDRRETIAEQLERVGARFAADVAQLGPTP